MSASVENQAGEYQPRTLKVQDVGVPTITIISPQEFLRVVSERKPEYVFWNVDHQLDGTAGLLYGNIMLSTIVNGYSDFTELTAGFERGYAKGEQYRHAQTLGAGMYEEYQAFIGSGYETISDFREIMKTDIPVIHNHWVRMAEELLPADNAPEFENLFEFVQASILENAGFTDVVTEDVIAILDAGFRTYADYASAREAGFEDAESYFRADRFSISTRKEYAELERHGITSIPHWLLYRQDNEAAIQEGFTNILGKLLHTIYNSPRLDMSWPISSIKQQVARQILNKYQIKCGPYYGIYHKDGISTLTAITRHPDIKNLVVYSDDLTISRRNLKAEEARAINIDLCNVVLYGVHGADVEKKGDVDKVLVMISKLREFGAEEINVFADASYLHYLTKAEALKVKKAADLWVPADKGFPADTYMLKYAEQNPSCIISNDNFERYRDERSPWIYENIPRVLVNYSFDGEGQVSFGRKHCELLRSDD
jgi:hypothetical protein